MARDTITAKPWTVTMTPTDIRLHHSQHVSPISLTDMMSAMPIWAPAIIRAALAEIEKLRSSASTIPTAGTVQPIETAPRDGTCCDIWVRRSVRDAPYRVADATYSSQASWDGTNGYHPGWVTHANGRQSLVYLDKDAEVVGWSPIPKHSA